MKFLLLFIVLSLPLSAEAATRKVNFFQIGINRTINGLGSAVSNLTCIITITNVSAVSQQIRYTFSVSAAGTGSGVATLASPPSNPFTLTAGTSQSLTYSYPSYPARPGTTAGTQTLTCAGEIEAVDSTPTTPGFVIANGSMMTFIEGGQISSSLAMSGGGNLTGNQAIYTQIPISINKGRPF